MERAYAAHREEGEFGPAAANALWLSREFAAAYGNAAASAGWYARAEGLLRDAGDVPEQGWLSLTHAERSDRPGEMAGTRSKLSRRPAVSMTATWRPRRSFGSGTRRSPPATSCPGWRRWTRP